MKMIRISLVLTLFCSIALLACGGGGKNPKLAKADELREQEHYDEALTLYHELVGSNPEMKEAYTGRAICRMNTQAFEAAKKDFERAIEISADSKYKNRDDYNEFRGIDFYYRGILHSAFHENEAAIADFGKAIEYGYNLRDAYTQRGVSLGLGNDFVAAVKDLDKALEIDPDYLLAVTNRAFYLSAMGDNRRAIVDFNKAIELKPEDKSSWVNRAYTFLNLGELDNALADVNHSLELDPDYMAGLTYKGIILQHMGRNEEAIETLTRGIQLYPDYAKLWYSRGVCKLAMDDMTGACEDLMTAKANGDYEGEGLREQFCY